MTIKDTVFNCVYDQVDINLRGLLWYSVYVGVSAQMHYEVCDRISAIVFHQCHIEVANKVKSALTK